MGLLGGQGERHSAGLHGHAGPGPPDVDVTRKLARRRGRHTLEHVEAYLAGCAVRLSAFAD